MPYAVIDAASSGVNEILPALSGKRYAVLNYTFVGAGAVAATWKTGTAKLTGAMSIGAAGGGVSSLAGGNSNDPLYLFETVAGDALNLVLSGAVQVSGHVSYKVLS